MEENSQNSNQLFQSNLQQYYDNQNNETTQFIVKKVQKNNEKLKRNFGKCMPFFIQENGEPYIVLGADWILFCFAFIAVIVFNLISLQNLREKNINYVYLIILLIFFIVHLSFYLITALQNQGILSSPLKIDSDQEIQNPNLKVCYKCNTEIKGSIKHCTVCDICIEGFNHHCPWVGKCIGSGNQKSFNWFVYLSVIYMFIVIVITIITTRVTHEQNLKKEYMSQ